MAPPPSFLRLAGHPVRWRLMSELAHSDRRVRELCGLLGLEQSLVSYHLGLLRADGVVSMRRSAADGRDAYYSLDAARLGELLAEAGGALRPAPPVRAPRVLFLCTGNSSRSQMAEAFAQRRGARAFSAGSHPKPLHPEAVRVMGDRGIDIAGRRSKHLDEYAGERFDQVITLCDRVREVCPEFPGHPELVHWSVPDPSRDGDFAGVADEIERRVDFLLEVPA
jgi:ArsR family transcriptional regulator, arsenate/arsenite/antimonite-responsive transcriptional repressor / arsenate reductase (thioredoxin)